MAMIGVIALVLARVCRGSVSFAVEEASPVCGFGAHGACTQQRRGQALLQHQHVGNHQGMLQAQEDIPRSSTAYVQVSSSGIYLPPQLAMWTNGSAGLMQLKEKAQHHAASSSMTSPDGGVPLEEWISQTLIPQAQLTITQLNHELEAAKDQVGQCESNKKDAEDGIADDKAFLVNAEGLAKQCEVTNKEGHQEAVASCQAFKDFYMKQLSPPSFQNRLAEVDAGSHTYAEFTKDARAFTDYVKSQAPLFRDKSSSCSKLSGLDAHTATECLEDRRGIEKSYCSLKKAQMDICADFAGCENDKKASFEKVKSDVKKLEEHVRANFRAMTCWNTGSSDCDAQAVNVGHLSVSYPVLAEDVFCSKDIGTSWDYSHVDCPELRSFEESDESATPASTNGTSSDPSSPIM